MEEQFKKIKENFPTLSIEQLEKLKKLGELYLEWNQKINLISRKDVENIYINHILHSLSINKVIKFQKGTKILDVGTGGGLPGLPLAITNPETDFYLIDSIGKKIMVVEDIIQKLELKNVKAKKVRAEQIEEKFDFIVSRAVTRLDKFMKWTANNFNKNNKNSLKNGILYLKGGDLTEEINEINKKAQIFEINKLINEEFFKTKKIVYVQF